MGKYDNRYYEDDETKPKQPGIHPIWRGIGLIFMVISPIISYFAAVLILQENAKHRWYIIPYDLVAKGSDPLLYAKIILSIIILFGFFVIVAFVTFVIFRFLAPPRYGPTDVPPINYRGKKYKR